MPALPTQPTCPFCGSIDVTRELAFGSALSKSQYSCGECTTVFERIRWEAARPAERRVGE